MVISNGGPADGVEDLVAVGGPHRASLIAAIEGEALTRLALRIEDPDTPVAILGLGGDGDPVPGR